MSSLRISGLFDVIKPPFQSTLKISASFIKSSFSTSRCLENKVPKRYPVLIIGGGSGGCTMAAKVVRKLGGKNAVAVVEPSESHYYQPLWTLVGGGLANLPDTCKPMHKVLPKGADWIKDKVATIDPEKNSVVMTSGTEIHYDYLIVATGLQLDFGKIKGLPDAFEVPGVCSNYSTAYVEKTREAIQGFPKNGGNAIFTFPNTPIKCPGAPQKIAYLAEEQFRKNGIRDKVNVIFNSSLPVIFGVKKYADALNKYAVSKRDIKVNFRHNLVEVKPDTKEAVFELLDSETSPKETVTFPFKMLHITPPMSTHAFIRETKSLVNEAGFVNVCKDHLQHLVYPNIFSLGDCSSLPTSKTAAAIAGQSAVLIKNIEAVMNGRKPTHTYDGYTSCPLVTGKGKCILAEFDYNAQPLETFPFNQGKERFSMFHLKADAIPFIYWNIMLKGFWNGPQTSRKILHLGMSR